MDLKIYFLPLLLISSMTVKAQNIEVVISGIRSPYGQLLIGIFKDENSFQNETPFISKKFEKNKIINGEMKVTFSLDTGTYGISLLDDENNECKMNYNFLGIPEEGFGFSNYNHTGFTKPEFDAFKFVENENKKNVISIKVSYITKKE